MLCISHDCVLYLQCCIFLEFHIVIATQMLCYLLPSNTWKKVKTKKYVMDFYQVSNLFWLNCMNVVSCNSGLHHNACSK